MNLMKQAVRKNFEEKASYFAKSLPHMIVADYGSFLVVDCGLASDTFNVIVVRNLSDPTHLLNEGVGYFMSKRFPMAIWYWEQDVDNSGLEALRAYGLVHNETNVAMYVELTGSKFNVTPPEGLMIQYAQSPKQIQQYGDLLARLFSNSAEGDNVAAYFNMLSEHPMSAFPAMRHYLGKYHDEVVATGTLFIGSETVGIYDIVTRTDYRHRGIGSAMFAHLLNEAKSCSRHYAVLQASAAGIGIYQKAGFRSIGNVQVFENRALL